MKDRIALSFLLVLAGCTLFTAPGADGYEDCTARVGIASVSVTVLDSITNELIGIGTTVTWQAGRSHGTMQPSTPKYPIPDGYYLVGPMNRPGTFALTITRAGYIDARRSVFVKEGQTHCSVSAGVHLVVLLMPKQP
ncbi:MAG: hypothetical protein Q8K82_12860 [Gemmatimonadaceae bacterium]|nr:hypothetical protein [Gemmatimonadaceae bacterium]